MSRSSAGTDPGFPVGGCGPVLGEAWASEVKTKELGPEGGVHWKLLYVDSPMLCPVFVQQLTE